MLSNLQTWLIGWMLMLVVGTISGALVFELASLLHWKAGWHREASIAIVSTIGLGCLIASEPLQMRWLALAGLVFGGPIIFIFAAAPLIIIAYGVRWTFQKLRGTGKSDDGQ